MPDHKITDVINQHDLTIINIISEAIQLETGDTITLTQTWGNPDDLSYPSFDCIIKNNKVTALIHGDSTAKIIMKGKTVTIPCPSANAGSLDWFEDQVYKALGIVI